VGQGQNSRAEILAAVHGRHDERRSDGGGGRGARQPVEPDAPRRVPQAAQGEQAQAGGRERIKGQPPEVRERRGPVPLPAALPGEQVGARPAQQPGGQQRPGQAVVAAPARAQGAGCGGPEQERVPDHIRDRAARKRAGRGEQGGEDRRGDERPARRDTDRPRDPAWVGAAHRTLIGRCGGGS